MIDIEMDSNTKDRRQGMFSTDKPITNAEDDKLGRSGFAERLAKAIINFDTADSYAIALQGSWGCGKTSVLNMAIQKIEETTDKKTVIIKFNPWNFTTTGQLIDQFFATMSSKLKLSEGDKRLQKVGGLIEKYSSVLEYTQYIPVVGPYLDVVKNLAKAAGKEIKETADKKLHDATIQKAKIEEALKEIDFQILVVIDDIDRLPNDQIRLIFQLVNSVAGFPHMVYLLSYDKDIVARALDDVQGYRGAEYLEKIIQVPFDLPPIDKYRVRSILKDELEKIRNIPNSVEVDSAHWEQIFGYCIAPIVTSLRDVKRFCNVLSFSYAAVKPEVDFSDMAGITAIKVFAPTIYEWIYANRMSLAGGYRGGAIALSGVKDYRAEMKRIAERIYPDDPEYMLDALACLFPSFGNRITYASDFQTPAELHQALRIASESKFDLYFSLSLENVKIPKIELDNSLLRMSICDLREYVAKLKEHGDLYEYIIEVERNLSRIPADRVPVLIDGLAFEHGYIDGDKPLVGANEVVFRTQCIRKLLMKIEDEQERYRIIETILCCPDIKSFDEITVFMSFVSRNYQRTHERDEARLVDENEIDVLRGIYLNRIREFTKTTFLLNSQVAQEATVLWREIDCADYKKYIKETCRDDICAVRVLATSVGEWRSDGEVVKFELSEDSYTEIMNREMAIDIIRRARTEGGFWDLQQDDIIRIAAFSLLVEKNAGNEKMAAIDEVNKRVVEWKAEYEAQQ